MAEGFVWLKSDVQARAIVEITNVANKSRIVCEALQLERNFRERYNKPPRAPINESDMDLALVVNHWYRARLGQPGEPLRTKTEYSLTVRSVSGPCARIRACLDHPQVVVRVSSWLGILGFLLGTAGVLFGLVSIAFGVFPELTSYAHDLVRHRPTIAQNNVIAEPRRTSLAVDEVLGWRDTYGDLLGKTRDVAIGRFGRPIRRRGSVSRGMNPLGRE